MARYDWHLFDARLAETLRRLAQAEEDTVLVVSVEQQPDTFVQYICGHGGLIAEASAFRFARRRRMSRQEKRQVRRRSREEGEQLRALGWRRPSRLPGSNTPNWWCVPKGDPPEAGQLAADMSVRTLRDVYLAPEPSSLAYTAWLTPTLDTVMLDELGIAVHPEAR